MRVYAMFEQEAFYKDGRVSMLTVVINAFSAQTCYTRSRQLVRA